MIQLLGFIFDAVHYLLSLYSFLLIAAAILRLARADETSIIGRMVFPLTDPPANALSRKFPKLRVYSGGAYIDFAPLLLLIIVQLLMMLLNRLKFMIGV
ncbi:MAG: YggT family protein [Silvanigrellaceae bacterium]